MRRSSMAGAPVAPALALPEPMRLALLWIVATAAVLVPLAFATVPPLVDYPNHLARLAILAGQAGSSGNYVAAWRFLPNLAMDLIVPPLAVMIGVVQATRLFLALTLAGLLAGSMTLHRAVFGRWSAWPLCVAPFLFNAALFWGLLAFLFAGAGYLFGLAAWLRIDDRRPLARAALFTAVGLALLMLHAVAFGMLAVSIIAIELAATHPRSLGRR